MAQLKAGTTIGGRDIVAEFDSHKSRHAIGGVDVLTPADIGAVKNTAGVPELLADVLANRPTAGVVGRLFFATDTGEIYRDNGTTWDLAAASRDGLAAHLADYAKHMFNVRDFGAKGDGVTDDYSAFASALSKPDPVFVPEGTYVLRSPIQIPNDKTIIGFGRESKLIFDLSTSSEYGLLIENRQNILLQGLYIERSGFVTPNANNSVIVIRGNTDETVKLENIFVKNSLDATGVANASTRAIHLYDSASPILANVIAEGGVSTGVGISVGISVGAKLNASGQPKLYSCIGRSPNGLGLEFDNTVSGTGSYAEDCIGEGFKSGIHIDDNDTSILNNCIGKCQLVDYGNGIKIYSIAHPTLIGCIGYAGGYAGGGIVVNGGATPRLIDCTGVNGIGNSTIGIALNDNAYPEMVNCRNDFPTITKVYRYKNATPSFVISDVYTVVLENLTINVRSPQAGVTLNIGTTSGGTEIATNVPLTEAGWVAVPFTYEWSLDFTYSPNAAIYVTPSSPIPDDCFEIYVKAIPLFNNTVGLDVKGNAGVNAVGGMFKGVAAAAYNHALSLSTNRRDITFAKTSFILFKHESNIGTGKYAIYCASPSTFANFVDCYIRGSIYNFSSPLTSWVPTINTEYKSSYKGKVKVFLTVTFNPTSSDSATCTVSFKPQDGTYQDIITETVPAGMPTGIQKTLQFELPEQWYWKATGKNVTLDNVKYIRSF